MSSTLSIYIPRMAAFYDEESIINVMSDYKIGTVSHVDFTPINKKPGFGEKVDEVVKSAFVHFSDPIMVSNHFHYSSRLTFGNENFWNTVLRSSGPYKLQVSIREYWLCLKNNNPVQRTLMNIHQVVENGRHLENLIEEQAEKLKAQEETIKNLSEKLENVHQVVYQLIGGLFNQKNQSGTLSAHFNVLFKGSLEDDENYDDTGNWKNWPTTRQGDENERRIESLEQTVRDMLTFDLPEAVFTPQEDDEEQDNYLYARKFAPQPYRMPTDEDLVSTHSSMPELEECHSVSTHSSMPDLEECSSQDSGERIRNSFELCGNE